MIRFVDWRNFEIDQRIDRLSIEKTRRISDMAQNEQELEMETQRIEGQLLVAKQICRENVGLPHSNCISWICL